MLCPAKTAVNKSVNKEGYITILKGLGKAQPTLELQNYHHGNGRTYHQATGWSRFFVMTLYRTGSDCNLL